MTSAVVLCLTVTLAADSLGPGDHSRELVVDGRERSYLIHVPRQYDSKNPTPVILAFHGGGGNAESMIALGLLKDSPKKAA